MRKSAAFIVGLIAIAVSITTAQQGRRVDDSVLRAAAQGTDDWLTYGLDQAETRFSRLADINTSTG